MHRHWTYFDVCDIIIVEWSITFTQENNFLIENWTLQAQVPYSDNVINLTKNQLINELIESLFKRKKNI